MYCFESMANCPACTEAFTRHISQAYSGGSVASPSRASHFARVLLIPPRCTVGGGDVFELVCVAHRLSAFHVV